MGKDNKREKNRKHHHRKDRKGKEERSKKEHYLRKDKDKKAEKDKKIEIERYFIDPGQHQKLLKILRDLIAYNQDTRQEIPEVFLMLDSGNEIDITDIEDGAVREALEKIFSIFSKQIEKGEDFDGRDVYSRSGNKSLKEQIENYFEKAKSAPNADHISELLSPSMQKEMDLPGPQVITQPLNEAKIREEIHKLDQANRPKSLMEMHLEKNKPTSGAPEKYIYGHKALQKRFAPGKFN